MAIAVFILFIMATMKYVCTHAVHNDKHHRHWNGGGSAHGLYIPYHTKIYVNKIVKIDCALIYERLFYEQVDVPKTRPFAAS